VTRRGALETTGPGEDLATRPSASLATNALGMAIQSRRPSGTMIHSDHGTLGQLRSVCDA
jgi:transposase InsO family protein